LVPGQGLYGLVQVAEDLSGAGGDPGLGEVVEVVRVVGSWVDLVEQLFRAAERGDGRGGVAEAPVRPGFSKLGEGQDAGRSVALGPLVGAERHVDGLVGVALQHALERHGAGDVGAHLDSAAGLGQAQGLDEVLLGDGVPAAVERGPGDDASEFGGGGEKLAAGLVAVAAAEERNGLPGEALGDCAGAPVTAAELGVPPTGLVGGLPEVGDLGKADAAPAALPGGGIRGTGEPVGDGVV
jgi:hypothetical protein